jgi:hypothetical protein
VTKPCWLSCWSATGHRHAIILHWASIVDGRR